jgi:hypothetical protein
MSGRVACSQRRRPKQPATAASPPSPERRGSHGRQQDMGIEFAEANRRNSASTPSLLRRVRRPVRVKASRSAAASGQGWVTAGPARKCASGVSLISLCRLRL